MIQEVGPFEFKVSKWEGKNYPTAVYDVTGSGSYMDCSCPVRGDCKHIALVEKWLKEGKPAFIDDSNLQQYIKNILSENDLM